MQKHDVYEKPIEEKPYVPDWTPPAPPNVGEREWFAMIYERFGFLIASGITVLILGILFLNTDLLLREPDTAVDAVSADTETPFDAQGTPPGADILVEDISESAGRGVTTAGLSILPDSLIVSVPLSITTSPEQASIYVNGALIGTSPLKRTFLPQGRYLLSVQSDDFAQIDTFITVRGDSVSLQLSLAELPAFATEVEEGMSEDSLLAFEEEEDASTNSSDSSLLAVVQDQHEEPEAVSAIPSEEQAPTEELNTEEEHEVVRTDSDETTPPVPSVETPEGEETAAVADVVEEVVPPVGSLQINSEPVGASVTLNGQVVGVTPVMLTEIPVGAQSVTLTLEGYTDYATTITVVAQERTTVNGVLDAAQGTLRVLAKPWGTIYIDGTLHKREADIWYSTKLAPGTYTVEIEHDTLGRWKQQVVIVAGEERRLEVDFN